MMRRAEVLRKRRLLDDFIAVDEVTVRHERADGTMTGPLRRLSVERGDGAAVLLRRRRRGTVLLVRQFRCPVLAHGNAWLLEAVAGKVDAGETPEAAARREIEEETGYRVGGLTAIGWFYPSPGGSSERIYLFCAELGDAPPEAAGGGVPSEHEEIEVVELTLAEAWSAVAAGEIADAKTIISLQWLRLAGPGPA